MFTVDQILAEYYPDLCEKRIVSTLVKPLLRHLLHEKAFIEFAETYPHAYGIDFVEQVLKYFHFSYTVSDQGKENIPSKGKLMIIANHPIGSLDGLALIKMIHDVRPDVKIVVNNLLMSLGPLRPCILPVNILSGKSVRRQIRQITQSLYNEEAVIMFPSGEVSRLSRRGIEDGFWHHGFLRISESQRAPILPIFIKGRNSFPFYFVSAIIKPLSTLMLIGQLFYQHGKQIDMTVGAVIPFDSYSQLPFTKNGKVKLLKEHVYRIGEGKEPLLNTLSPVARQESRIDLEKEVRQGILLGKTPKNKAIYLFDEHCPDIVLREIGRLREITFRYIGEGTGKNRDVDEYDTYYQHVILWDKNDSEIAGAYRFADAGQVVTERGLSGLYSESLFKYDLKNCYFLENGLELGRSFVQQKYWGKRSLDYLWHGIGAYLCKNTQYRFLFGPVSISNAIHPMAKELLVYFYKLYFSSDICLQYSRNPFLFKKSLSHLASEFKGDDYGADFRKLKSLLSNLGTAIPTLYKQYTQLCDPGGVVFLDFNVDPAFNYCIDGLVIVDVTKIKRKKRQRYMNC